MLFLPTHATHVSCSNAQRGRSINLKSFNLSAACPVSRPVLIASTQLMQFQLIGFTPQRLSPRQAVKHGTGCPPKKCTQAYWVSFKNSIT